LDRLVTAASDPPVATATGRGLWFAAPRQAELREEELGPIGDGEILVRALASLVSAGTEMRVYRGEAESAQITDIPTTRGTFPFPIKYAYQIVGEVEEAGPESGYARGDRVFAYHPHQDRFLLAVGGGRGDDLVGGAKMVFPVPAELAPERAAFANLFNVAYNALLDTPVHIGDVVVVSGLGVVGTFAAQLAKPTAGALVLVDPIPERRERAAWIGADAVVDPADAAAAIAELSEGRGSDLWVEASGAPAALQTAIANTGNEGTITIVSNYGSDDVRLRLVPEFHLRRQKIVSSMVGVVGSGLQPRWSPERRMATTMRMLGEFPIERLITHRVEFARAVEAYEQIDRRPHESLGVLLTYDEKGNR
jgi:2-desacetyl-2-hydroxyethyl bacteriochlorophyllide A dehydrogenase